MALNVGNLVATLGLDKKEFDSDIQDAAKKTEGFAAGFSSKLSSLSAPLAAIGEKLKGAVSGFSSKLSSLSAPFAAVGSKFKGVVSGISSGLSSLAAPIGAAKDKLIGLATDFASKMKTLAVPIAAVGAAIASLGTAAVLAADNINKTYNAIRVGSGATGEDLEALKSDFDAVFGTIPAGAGEVGTAIADLNTRLGLTGKPLQNMATRFLELSRITGTDVASNIKEVTRLFGNWNVAAEEQTGMLDYLFKVSQSTGIGVDRLSTLTTQYGSTLRGLGFDLKDSVAVLGKFEKGGVNIEAVLAGMKMGLGNLAGKGITDPVEALDELARQVREAGTEIEAVSIAAEVFGARGAAEMAAAIRSGNLDLGDFVTMLDASEETVLTAADASMSLGDRMAILQHKAEKALEPVGNLLIGVFEDAIPFLEGAGDHLADIGQGIADWAVQAQAAAAPFVAALQDQMAPAVEFFEGRLAHIIDWWEENGPIFIAAWENIAAAIQWVVETVIVPIIEWAWPYIETIISGVLDVILGAVKLFASLIAGDWEAAGDALTDISKGAMQALVGVISAGWDIIATGIEFVGQGILDFVYGLWSNIVQWTEDSINQMIDLINGFIQAINSVTGKVGISLPTIGHISLKADKIEAPKIKIPRWSETEIGKNLDAVLRKEEEEEEEEEEDIDKEFEDEPEREPAPALPKSQLPVAPKPEIPPIPPTSVEIPETEPPTIPDLPEPGVPESSPAPTPAFDLPIPVTVINWPDTLKPVPAVPLTEEERVTPADEDSDIDEEFVDLPEPTIVWPDLLATFREPKVSEPVVDAPDVVVPAVGVSVQEIPDIPEPTVPELSSRPIPPAFDLPIPVTVINWPDTLKPVPAAPLTEEERVTPADKEPDVDEEFVDLPEPTIVWPDLPKIQIPKIQIPDIVAAAMPPDPDAGALARILGLIGGGETRVVVELDGYAIGETLFRTWNRRTGGALNG